MSMTIQSYVKDNIFATPSETSKVENAPAEMLRDLDQQMEKRADDDWRWYDFLVGFGSAAEILSFEQLCAPFEALYGMKCSIDKRKLHKRERDRQKSYADNRRKPLEFEVGDQVMLKVSPWKCVIHFGKKGKLAPRQVVSSKISGKLDEFQRVI
ncbi:hypothetical protein Tco_0089341 [Tanacetum coccineum]